MPRPRYPILAIDLDGTLLGPDLRVVPASGVAVRRFLAAGGRVVVATGRTERSIERYRDDLDLDGLAIVYQGARVAHLTSQEVLLDRRLPAGCMGIVRRAMRDPGGADVVVLGFTGEEVVALEPRTPVARAALDAYQARDHVAIGLIRDPGGLDERSLLKILLVTPMPRAQSVEDGLRAALPGCHVVRSEPMYVEILDREVDKGSALGWLLAMWGSDPDQVVAVGNGLNDRELLAAAGVGIAVGDAHPGLKAVADIVVRACTDGGVADAVAIAMGEESATEVRDMVAGADDA